MRFLARPAVGVMFPWEEKNVVKLASSCVAAVVLVALSILVSDPAASRAAEPSVAPGINKPFADPNVEDFVGRFEREGRSVYDHRHEIVEACEVKPGMTVADVGAGTGLFTRLFSPLVKDRGKVYAVDISEEFVRHVEEDAKERGMTNVVGVVCDAKSVNLPEQSVDLVFICDTYHHFEFPASTMQSIHHALKPNGQLVLIDFHRIEGVSSDWILNHVRAGEETVRAEVEAAGFKFLEEREHLVEDSYFLRFAKVTSEK